jgi:hypothetical protein
MTYRPFIMIAIIIVLCFSGNTAESKKLYDFKVGNWSGYAWQSNKTGKFSHCTVKAIYKSDIQLSFTHYRSKGFSIDLKKRA